MLPSMEGVRSNRTEPVMELTLLKVYVKFYRLWGFQLGTVTLQKTYQHRSLLSVLVWPEIRTVHVDLLWFHVIFRKP